jgi:ABC-type transporter Mla subunit MlaD
MAESAARAEVQRLLKQLNTAISQQRQVVTSGKGNLAAANAAVDILRAAYNDAQYNLTVILNS